MSALDEILQCKNKHYSHKDNVSIFMSIIPMLLSAYKTRQFCRNNAVKISAALIAMIENFDDKEVCDKSLDAENSKLLKLLSH